VIEFKRCNNEEELVRTAQEALAQIHAQSYDRVLRERNVRDIVHVGMAFCGTRVHIAATE
jgi:hypothetical protein